MRRLSEFSDHISGLIVNVHSQLQREHQRGCARRTVASADREPGVQHKRKHGIMGAPLQPSNTTKHEMILRPRSEPYKMCTPGFTSTYEPPPEPGIPHEDEANKAERSRRRKGKTMGGKSLDHTFPPLGRSEENAHTPYSFRSRIYSWSRSSVVSRGGAWLRKSSNWRSHVME